MNRDNLITPTMTWTDKPIDGCRIKPLTKYTDHRGWLAEYFRQDELPDSLHPAMGYISMTLPGIARGPHEHVHQTDLFLFFSGRFRLYLWDARKDSVTFGHREITEVGEKNQVAVIVPPGVVHAYSNIGETEGLVVNCPNQLYAGKNKKEPVDEIRHEDVEDSPYLLI